MTLPCGRNGVLSDGEVLDRGAGARRLVLGGQAPAQLLVAGGDRHEVGLDLVVRVGLGELVLATPRRYASLRSLVIDGKRSCRFSAV